MTGVWYHHDRDALAKLVAHFVHHGPRLERIERALQIEQRYRPARPPLGLFGGTAGGRLHFVCGGMPTLKPNTCIAIRGEESQSQISQPLACR
jgi:hypothetical protein